MTKRRTRGNPISPCGKWSTRSKGTSNSPNRADVTCTTPAMRRLVGGASSATLAICIRLPHRRRVGEPGGIRQPRALILPFDGEENLLAMDAHFRRSRQTESHLAAAHL